MGVRFQSQCDPAPLLVSGVLPGFPGQLRLQLVPNPSSSHVARLQGQLRQSNLEMTVILGCRKNKNKMERGRDTVRICVPRVKGQDYAYWPCPANPHACLSCGAVDEEPRQMRRASLSILLVPLHQRGSAASYTTKVGTRDTLIRQPARFVSSPCLLARYNDPLVEPPPPSPPRLLALPSPPGSSVPLFQ